ncbi:MAG: T9SS type A sorting domain-containing protein [Planctomycetes bacterium]|nr:T9SS type A sorting domain-containing protein [Planctomycetota bacterium]
MNCSQATVASHETPSSLDLLENAARLIISDASGDEQTLYFSPNLTGLSREQFSLPPLPPPGSFDIRFSGDTRLTTADETVIHIRGIDYPLTIRADNVPVEYGLGYALSEMIGDVEVSRHPLLEDGEIVIANSEATHLLLSRTALTPTVFAVEQNYPNPFNPITTIRYALPRSGPVEIRVYNIAGQQVKTLVDEKQKAGYYSVVWDGRNEQGNQVSSGTYFYMVKAGREEVLKKMVLLK